ncbi:MAG: phosphatidate cytidylyltransferase [Gammaproteobacteria bacterium]
MLKQRILTALILIPLVLFTLFFASYPAFAGITALVLLLGAWEWSPLMGLHKKHQRFAWIIFIAALFLVLYRLEFLLQPVLIVGALWWTCVTFALGYVIYQNYAWKLPSWLVGMSGILSLVPCWVALNALRGLPHGASLVLLLLLCVWGADTGAYFAGKQWGHRKLAPLISPKKSWEGFWGGAVVVVLIAGIGGHLFLGVMLFLVAVVGDLFESLLKRSSDIKDSGQLLPGHGGILDRIDSLLACAPIFALGIIVGL